MDDGLWTMLNFMEKVSGSADSLFTIPMKL